MERELLYLQDVTNYAKSNSKVIRRCDAEVICKGDKIAALKLYDTLCSFRTLQNIRFGIDDRSENIIPAEGLTWDDAQKEIDQFVLFKNKLAIENKKKVADDNRLRMSQLIYNYVSIGLSIIAIVLSIIALCRR